MSRANELDQMHSDKEKKIRELEEEMNSIRNQTKDHEMTAAQQEQELKDHKAQQDELRSQLTSIDAEKSDILSQHQ